MSGMPLHRNNKRLVSSSTWRRLMKQPGSMVSSETFTGWVSEADCLPLYQSIFATAEFESESAPHSLMNSTRKKVSQLVVYWLLHAWAKDQWAAISYRQGYLQSTFCWWPDDLFSWPLPGHHWETFAAGSYAIQEWATGNGFIFGAHKCKVLHFTAPRTRVQRPPNVRIGNTPLPVEESTKFLGLWWDSHLSFKKHIRALKTECKEALNLIRVVAYLKWGGDRETLLMLYRAIVRSKLDYGCIVYGTASNTDLRQLDSIHNAGVRLALGAFCTSPVSSMYTEAIEAPLEERRLKLSIH